MPLDSVAARSKRRRLPSVDVPVTQDEQLRRSLEALKEHIRMYEGDSGAPRERFVTIQELELAGLIGTKVQGNFALIDEVLGGDVSQGQQTGLTGGTVIINEGGSGGGAAATTLAALTDTNVAGAQAGSFLQLVGGMWVGSNIFGVTNTWDSLQVFNACLRVAGIDSGYVDFCHDNTDMNVTGSTTTDINLVGLHLDLERTYGIEWDDIQLLTLNAPGDPNWSDVTEAANFDGTDGQTTYTSDFGISWTFYGNAEISSDQSFDTGGTSLWIPKDGGDVDKIKTSPNPFLPGSSDFTIEFHMRPSTVGSVNYIMGINKPGSDNRSWVWQQTSQSSVDVVLEWDDIGPQMLLNTGNNSVNVADTWYHLAVMRSGTNVYLFLDGVMVASNIGGINAGSNLRGQTTVTTPMTIGTNEDDYSPYKGYIDNFRFSLVARYDTGGFTPPTAGDPLLVGDGQFVVGDVATQTQIDGSLIVLEALLEARYSATFDSTVNVTGGTYLDATLNVNGLAAFNADVDIDGLVTLNANEAGTPTQNAVVEVERGTSTNVSMRWNETTDRWEFTNDGVTFYAVHGPHTGEVTGEEALSLDVTAITNQTDVEADPADDVAIHDDTDGTLKKTNLSSITDAGYF